MDAPLAGVRPSEGLPRSGRIQKRADFLRAYENGTKTHGRFVVGFVLANDRGEPQAFAVFAVFFIVYIVLDWGMDITGSKGMSQKDYIGKVNDAKISYREFSELLKQQSEAYRKQTGAEADEETERQLRTQVLNMLVQQALVDHELNRLGVVVTDEEVREILLGSNPPEMVARQFRDSTGQFNRAAYEQAIMNPQNRDAVIQVEEQVPRQRRLEKLQSLLAASSRVSEGEVRQRFEDKSTTMEAEYVLFDPNVLVPDSAVQITDEDMRKYYNANQDDFKVKAARKLKYLFYSLVPTADDSADARIIPLDGRPPLPPAVRLWEGDSRGRWEGDTLVVETTNFGDRNWIATSAASGRIKGIPQSTALRIVERFTRVAPDRIDYEARVEDPEVITQPWTLAFPLARDEAYRVYEYACHEGNRAVEGVLRGARYQERTATRREP